MDLRFDFVFLEGLNLGLCSIKTNRLDYVSL